MGKLYINYPMIESYRHLKDIPDESYIGKLVSPLKYKEKVDNESVMKSLRKYTYPDFMYITSLNLRAAMFLLTKENRIPTKIEYLSLNWDEIYDIELDTFRKTESVYPLNTLLFFPIDYAPSVFFNQIKSHPDKFT